MNWRKLGKIQIEECSSDIRITYAAVPVAMHMYDNVFRVFLSNRDSHGRSVPYFIDFDIEKFRVIGISDQPLTQLGKLGAFDDSGVMPCCILKREEDIVMYYIGWNVCKTVPFRNSIGVLISKDNGVTFNRMYSGPILDRTPFEPYFCASCDVIKEKEIYKIWYLSCTEWKIVDGRPRHSYHIKYAESSDGINFIRNGHVAIDYKSHEEYAISVPRIIIEGGLYKMWYSYRGLSYRIGYAESLDGLKWDRKDEIVGIDVSKTGWDSEMICYPFIFKHNEKKYMLYNGNGYGQTGVGLAVLQENIAYESNLV